MEHDLAFEDQFEEAMWDALTDADYGSGTLLPTDDFETDDLHIDS